MNTRVPIHRHGIQRKKAKGNSQHFSSCLLKADVWKLWRHNRASGHLVPRSQYQWSYNQISVCGRNTTSIMSQPFLPFTGQALTSGMVSFCQKPGLLILAHQLASGPDAFGQNLIRPSRLALCNRIQAFFGRMELNRMRHVWSSPILAARCLYWP